MRPIRMVGSCALAALALGVVASASASAAEPAFYECVKARKVDGKYTGRFTNRLCSEEASAEEIEKGETNTHELREGIGKGRAWARNSDLAPLRNLDLAPPRPTRCGPFELYRARTGGGGEGWDHEWSCSSR